MAIGLDADRFAHTGPLRGPAFSARVLPQTAPGHDDVAGPLGPQCADYSVATDRFEDVYYAAFRKQNFIGWGWCGWMDQWHNVEPVKQHGGLQDAFGNWHQPLADRMAKFGGEMYRVASER